MHWPKWSQTKDSEATQHAKTKQKGGACSDFCAATQVQLARILLVFPRGWLVVTRMFIYVSIYHPTIHLSLTFSSWYGIGMIHHNAHAACCRSCFLIIYTNYSNMIGPLVSSLTALEVSGILEARRSTRRIVPSSASFRIVQARDSTVRWTRWPLWYLTHLPGRTMIPAAVAQTTTWSNEPSSAEATECGQGLAAGHRHKEKSHCRIVFMGLAYGNCFRKPWFLPWKRRLLVIVSLNPIAG